MKLVPISHFNSTSHYLFSTEQDLTKGTVVMCDTTRGLQPGTCLCDSFEVSENTAAYLLGKYGSNLEKLRPVVGYFEMIRFGGSE